MKELALVIYSKGPAEKTLELVKDMYSVVDEIVLVDSSEKAVRRVLAEQKKKLGLEKLRIYYVVPTGLIEMFAPFAISKCKSRWILNLDVDERISDDLKADIRKVINSAGCSAFWINKRSYTENSKIVADHEMHLRMYKKSDVHYVGMIHEHPTIEGVEGRLPYKYSIIQYLSNREDEIKKAMDRYTPMEMLIRRRSYAYLLKLLEKRKLGLPIRSYIKLKLKISKITTESELTKTDYRLLSWLEMLAFIIDSKDPMMLAYFSNVLQNTNNNYKKIDMFFAVEPRERVLQYNISRDIEKAGGVAKYLNLYSDGRIRELNKKYDGNNLKGVKLLEKMLKDRYYSLHNS